MGKRGRPPHPDILTPRQWQVLALLREGLTCGVTCTASAASS